MKKMFCDSSASPHLGTVCCAYSKKLLAFESEAYGNNLC